MVHMDQRPSGTPPYVSWLAKQRRMSPPDMEPFQDHLTEVCAMGRTSEGPVTVVTQKIISPWPETLSEERANPPRGQGSFTKSLQKAEALLRNGMDLGSGRPCEPPPDRGGPDAESEDTFVACENLTTRSSRRLQRLEQSMLGMRQHCHVLHHPSTGVRGCVRGSSLEGEVYHHPAAAAVAQHYGHVHGLLEERAQLLFLHEYARRSAAVAQFVEKLTSLLEWDWPGSGPGGQGAEQSVWECSVIALCVELRGHVGHWDSLRAKVRADGWLRRASFRRTGAFRAMRQALDVLGLKALMLTERCLSRALSALALAEPGRVSTELLDDLLIGTKAFNHILAEQRVRMRGCRRTTLPLLLLNQVGPSVAQPCESVLPEPLSISRLLRIMSEQRAWLGAERYYQWLANQSHFLSASSQAVHPSQSWERYVSYLNPSLTPADRASSASQSRVKRGKNSAASCPAPPAHPLSVFVRQDGDLQERLLQSLMSSADLLVPHIPSRPKPEHPTGGGSPVGQDLKAQPEKGHQPDGRKWKSVQWQDIGRMEACTALLAQYEDVLWQHFGRALLCLLYQPGRTGLLGSLNHCSDHMVFLVVKELYRSCRMESLPAECERVIYDLCMTLMTRSAFMHWDDVMCASLGTGLKDKCLPKAGSRARTSTTDLLLRLFHPLNTVLSCLETSVMASDCGLGLMDASTVRSFRLGLLSRSTATIHSATVWVTSRAYHFLSSWSLSKFLLVTQGDLKVLMAAVERLVQQVEAVPLGRDSVPSFSRVQEAQLRQTAAELQGFSNLVLKLFYKDCKKMCVEIFQQTMPSGKHWRMNSKKELPTSPSEYATSAAHGVVGQVLDSVQPLTEEAQVPVLTEAVTVFMEAWMEHILRHKIKFSIQGALQLKQDFDVVRGLVRSEESGLSEESHQQLLSLRVFHQADSAIVCLLQQPVAKLYVPQRAWEPFRRCCSNSSHPLDVSTGSLHSLESMDIQAARNQALTEAEGSLAPQLPSSSPPESYLAVSQHEWLALRVHSSSRWRIPGLHCMSKPEH